MTLHNGVGVEAVDLISGLGRIINAQMLKTNWTGISELWFGSWNLFGVSGTLGFLRQIW